VNLTAILVGIALVGGMAVTLQGQFMGQMDRNIGFKQISGLLVILVGAYLVTSEA
jgi:uncharacterized membrane protein YdcZ (DUF606 family)